MTRPRNGPIFSPSTKIASGTGNGPILADSGYFGRAMASLGDLDGDGDLDAVLTASGGAPRLLRNDQKLGHHWLRVKLVGRAPNREALGATVKLKSGSAQQSRVVMSTRSYCSASELPVTFGLGAFQAVDGLEIRWPDGKMQAVNINKVDQLIRIEQE